MAGGWRVRKLKPKGAPEVVYGREGIPLILPIDADMDALRHEARTEDKAAAAPPTPFPSWRRLSATAFRLEPRCHAGRRL